MSLLASACLTRRWPLVEEMSIRPGVSSVEIQEARVHMDGLAHTGMIMHEQNIDDLRSLIKSFA